ncbi:glycosyltransferase family 4 protein [Tessaracoccus sp. HDW20]|uniref:glycosyltransferase n=1 Tax=Tessaracoccus coleopterorum TaxID=2714950 RepID=UPI0018D2D1AA|nr:glycosyltransferase [Tessaracoccus coleopterorum]NHB85157.1 glycosyltransferase family 4 protein [Tessaracoccus coleopterorum]
MKGSDDVDDVCGRLQAEGLIRYVRDEDLTRTQMRDRMMNADIVIDQLRLGDYGITAVEAMAGGKVVLGHVAARVRNRIAGEVPIVEADATTLEDVLRRVLADPARAAELSAAGRAYVERWHDGTRSAEVLADFMGL